MFFDADALRMVETTLRKARHSIDMEMYLIGGAYGAKIMRILDQKARQGVRVRLIHATGRSLKWAAWLKRYLPKALLVGNDEHLNRQPHYLPVIDSFVKSEMVKSGIRMGEFPLNSFSAPGWNPMRSAHDKIVLVDGATVIAGGMNLATAVSSNHDLLVRVTGPVVHCVADVFEYDWRLSTAGHAQFPHMDDLPIEFVSSDAPRLKFLVTRPHCENQYETILSTIQQAYRRIWIQMYCLTDTGILGQLAEARHRGIDVRALLDANRYSLGLRLHGAPNLAFCQKLLAEGVAVHIYRSVPGRQMHQKSMLVDDDLVMTGATNFTRQSFRVNTESMFLIKCRKTATIFKNRFLSDWRYHSDPLRFRDLSHRRLYDSLVRWISRFL